MTFAGINALITTSMQKVDNANNNAMDGATKQRKLVHEEQVLHAQQAAIQEMTVDGVVTADEYWKISGFMGDQGLAKTGVDGSWDGILGTYDSNGQWSAKLDSAGEGYQKKNADLMNGIKDRMDGKDKDLQNQDKLGNFEIQGLMGTFNESQTLASSVLNKKDSAGNAVVQKI